MSKYTTELRYICESLADLSESEGYDQTEEVIELARPKIFDFEYFKWNWCIFVYG